MPVGSVQQAQQMLASDGLVFLPLNALTPGLHNLLSMRGRLGVRNSAHSLVKMLNPFPGAAVLTAPATHPDYITLMRSLFQERHEHALLFRGTEGEPFANPKRRPRLEYIHSGLCDILFEAEHDSLRGLPNLPESLDAGGTARWMRRILEKQLPLPKPIGNQLASLLYASGYADDLNQAKAIVAVEATGVTMGGN